RMAIRVDSRVQRDDGWLIQGSSSGLSVDARLEPATPRLTRVSLRVEAGRLTADKQTSEALHDQIARLLVEQIEVARAPAPVPPETLAALEAQVRSLRMELERQRQAAPPKPVATEQQRPAMSVDSSAIISVPASYGVATPVLPRSATVQSPAP